MKRKSLLIAVLALVMLTACGSDKNHEKSAEQAEIEMPEPVAATEEPEDGISADGENTVLTERVYETESIYYCEYQTESIYYSTDYRGLSFRKDMKKTRTDYAVYYFEAFVSEQERNDCIAATDRMLSSIDAELPELEVVVLEPRVPYGASVSGNRLILTVQPWDSADYLAKVLLAGYGEWGNYGLAYGYADYLCKKAGLDNGKTDSEGQEADSFLLMSAPEAYDLNLLCFNERFVSPEDVEAAKNNASLFVKEYLASHSEEEFLELLSASGTVEGAAQTNKALEAFYSENGVECRLTEIRYQYGGLSFDYAAACKYARLYVYRDWQDKCWKTTPMVSENFLHEAYGEVRKFFECNERQMQQYRELFNFDSYDDSLLVFIQDLSGRSVAGYYRGDEHTIYLGAVFGLMHEYIHSVTYGRFEWNSWWKTEGLATYFAYKYDEYAYDYYNEFWNGAAAAIWVKEYIDILGRPIDVRTDISELWDLSSYVSYVNGDTDPDSYEASASFFNYLVHQYGEQAVMAYVCSDDEYNAEWGKSYEELVKDWNQYIEENYSQYSVY